MAGRPNSHYTAPLHPALSAAFAALRLPGGKPETYPVRRLNAGRPPKVHEDQLELFERRAAR
jgi:hypothetical protein